MKKEKNEQVNNSGIDKWTITISFYDGMFDVINNVIQFGPIPDRDLLAVTTDDETIIYLLNDKIKCYKINKNKVEV